MAIATHVIYYGHGESDWWTVLPSKPHTKLVDTSTVQLLQNAAVYAVCCWSLTGLGAAHAGISSCGYVGYDNRFEFDEANEDEFGRVVNQSAVNFVLTGNIAQTVADLQTEWLQLSNDFANGALRTKKTAGMATALALKNAQRIGSRP